jgi:hypothetical protein
MNGRSVGSESAAEEFEHSESIGVGYGWEFVIEFHSDTIIANGSGFVKGEKERKSGNGNAPDTEHKHIKNTLVSAPTAKCFTKVLGKERVRQKEAEEKERKEST